MTGSQCRGLHKHKQVNDSTTNNLDDDNIGDDAALVLMLELIYMVKVILTEIYMLKNFL